MSQSATSRLGLRAAPAGLELVQDFLNTRGIPTHQVPDLLSEPDAAQSWARRAVGEWARTRGGSVPTITMSPADLRELRAVRATFEQILATAAHGSAPLTGAQAPVPAMLVPGDGGAVALAPTGEGWRWLASALWIEVFRAQENGTWDRLKLCRNTTCASAFYDSSRNNSGVWHDVRTCGNAANLRASRERKRANTADAT